MIHLADLSLAIPIAALCILIAGFCSGTEVALFSLRRVDREQLSRSNAHIDRRILALLERPRRLVATVLIGNEVCAGFLAVVALSIVEQRMALHTPWLAVALASVVPDRKSVV